MDFVGKRHLTFLGLVIAVLFVLQCPDAAAQQTSLPPEVVAYADMVLYDGQVLTADEDFTVVRAVAIRDGKFLAIGESDRIVQMAGPNTRRIDLKGKTVIPGIIDLHQHPFTEGMLSYWAKKWIPNEPEGRNAQEALAGIKRAVDRAEPGQAVLIPRIYVGPAAHERGGREGEAICDAMAPDEKYRSTLPCAARNSGNLCQVLTREQIDSVSPNNPLIFVAIVNLGPYAINSKAAEAIEPYLRENRKIFAEEDNACTLGSAGGGGGGLFAPVRLIKDHLMFWSEPLEDQLEAFRMATNGISSAGITLVKEHTALPLITGIRELWARKELTVRLRMPYPLTPITASGNSVVVEPELAETLFRRIGNMSGIGDDMLRFVGIRPEGVGGNLIGGGAWTLKPRIRPYSSPEGRRALPYGGGGPGEGEQGPIEPGEELFDGREALVQAVRFGWDISADHTIGDRAVREVLNAIEEGLKTQVVKRPNQILHIGHTPIVAVEDIQRMKEMGVHASIGVWHIWLPSMIDAGVSQFGTEEFAKMAAPMRSYTERGLQPALEGDVPGAIFWRMEKAVTRKDDKYKQTWNRGEAVTRQEALWMSTLWGARILGEQDKLGSIEAGKLADLVVVDKDYMTIPEDDISEIETLMTIVEGKVVYETAGGL